MRAADGPARSVVTVGRAIAAPDLQGDGSVRAALNSERSSRSRAFAVSPVTGALAALYLAACVSMALGPLREFADETDNLLGGYLIAHGARLYVDYFSSHMPLLYYVAAIPALFGAATLDQFRVFAKALFIAATLAIILGFRGRVSLPVVLGWATLAVSGYLLSWGEMLHAGTWAGVGVFVAALLCYSTPRLAFGWWGKVALSAAVFLAVESAILAVYPLSVLAACYLVVRLLEARRTSLRREGQEAAVLAAVIVAPHLALLVAFWAAGMLGAFVYDAFQFNQLYYSQFIMNGSPIGILHDWEAQYRTYVAINVFRRPFGVEFWLILANLGAAAIVARTRGLVVGAAYYLFVGLSHVRADEAYYLTSSFSLALTTTWAASTLRRLWQERQLSVTRSAGRRWRLLAEAAVSVGALVVLGGFAACVEQLHLEPASTFRLNPLLRIVPTITSAGDRIAVAPYQPYIYLETGRRPATRYEFFFPWQAIDPKSSEEYFADLDATRPPVVIFHRHEVLNGLWPVEELESSLYDYLQQRYVPVDRDDPVLGDVFVRPDRIEASREALRQAGLYPLPGAQS